jgi:ubiquinone/menaquinone biosynthesis C-methylase UbiE
MVAGTAEKAMSSYEAYDRRAADYDRTRGPVGLEIIAGCLAQGAVPLHAMSVLDAGCGTGNYARALLGLAGRIEAVDLSAGMLAVARAKLAEGIAGGRVALHDAAIDALPQGDATVDGAMVNQVLHHLPDDPAAGWPAHRQVLAELARVLRPGGVVVLNSCSHHQIEHGFWPYHLIPAARHAVLRRLMPLDALEEALRGVGITPRGRFVPVDAVLQGADYLDPTGPLRTEWRAGDSIWALAEAAELAAAEAALRAEQRAGTLERYLASHDARRPEIGQITLLYGSKG